MNSPLSPSSANKQQGGTSIPASNTYACDLCCTSGFLLADMKTKSHNAPAILAE
jgi:hypothetical protein